MEVSPMCKINIGYPGKLVKPRIIADASGAMPVEIQLAMSAPGGRRHRSAERLVRI
jgi:hypothetical protein